ncbi:MAG: hypothetical protein N3F05_01035 [Candidatus Diapherotrites archaeon]|nr:hypothetical protein [Candidatus Diapherotrites archaeon]
MAVAINYRFSPLRMSLKKRDKVALDLFVKNIDDSIKKLTVRVMLPNELAFSKGGFKTAEIINIDKIMPAEERILYLEIWPKHNLSAGEKAIQVIVQEFEGNYQYTKNQTEKTISLIVD